MSSNTEVIEACTEKRLNAKLKSRKLAKVNVFTASLKEVPMRCQDAMLPEQLTKKATFLSNLRRDYEKTVI